MQHKHLYNVACKPSAEMIQGISGFLIFLLIGAVILNLKNGHSVYHDMHEITLVMVIFMSQWLVSWCFNRWQISRDIQKGIVKELHGTVKKTKTSGFLQNNEPAILCGYERLRVPGAVFNILQEYEVYWIYYAPVTRIIVAMKRVDYSKSKK